MDNDIVYPVSRVSNSSVERSLILTTLFVFQDTLDAGKLYTSLCRLLNIGDWRIFAGRLRRVQDGKVQIAAPRVLTGEYRPVYYTHETHDMVMDAHESAQLLPRHDGSFSALHPTGPALEALGAQRQLPSTFEQWLSDDKHRDTPIVSLFVNSFIDGTIVSIAIPHILIDAMAMADFFRAWSLVLAGKEEQVGSIVGVQDDLMFEAGNAKKLEGSDEPWQLKSKMISLEAALAGQQSSFRDIAEQDTAINSLLISQGQPEELQRRLLFLPARALRYLHSQVLAELAQQDTRDRDEKGRLVETLPSWVSQGDVVLAWFTRVVALSQDLPRAISICNVVNLRGRLPDLPTSNEDVYVASLLASAHTDLSENDARGKLSLIAAKSRQSVAQQSTPLQLRYYARARREAVESGQSSQLFFGLPGADYVAVTNWCKADVLGSLDFAPAIVSARPAAADGSSTREETDKRSTREYGRAHLLDAQLFGQEPYGNLVFVLSKDMGGNMLVSATFTPKQWKVVRQELSAINEQLQMINDQ
ncbi:LysR family regulatory protein [Beauveria bassiana ARSEF 2860]|uniref:LysR family regulatory protein n=1 Tax=Beauveria bassiana (strain ARSEF 2860) TaxID=655819 RepID=J4KR72_BEAB2|nr:LysR family regulatory protein [Beauveria bassiana ARSEF 2860]EJP70449.1 LysR family regulatory protein [Beauveria bassiana ARSEF 2860]